MEITEIKRLATQFTDVTKGDPRLASRVADLFANIEQHNLRVAEIVLGQKPLDNLVDNYAIGDDWGKEKQLWGANVIVSDKVEPDRIYVVSGDGSKVRWMQITD